MAAKTVAMTMAVLGSAVALAGCRDAQAKHPEPVVIATPAVAVATPVATPAAPRGLEIAGDLRPLHAAELSFKVGGQLATIRVARGEAVRAGQVIATLSDAEAKAQLAQAEAAAAAAGAQADMAEDQAARVEELAQASAAPEGQATAARHQAAAARAVAQQARAALALARVNADNHVLRAPFDGRIVRASDALGATLAPGMPVARLERLDVLVLHATLSETELDRVAVGDSVVVTTTAGHESKGRVRAVVRSLDGMSRRAPVEIEVPNPGGRLAAGAYVRAVLQRPVADATPRP